MEHNQSDPQNQTWNQPQPLVTTDELPDNPITVDYPEEYFQPVVRQTNVAGFWRRVLAYILDTIAISSLISIISTIVNSATSSDSSSLIFLVILSLYYTAMHIAFGQSLGKMVLNLRVVKAQSMETVSPASILLRETIGRLLCIITLGIGYVMAAFLNQKQGLHDLLSHTIVIVKSEEE
jgi:uncharacterized RDD family membrane protein YckC